MNYTFLIALSCATFFSISVALSQKLEAYKIFDAQGKEVDFTTMVKELQERDVVFFGESHNNPVDHWLQLEFVKAVDSEKEIVLGAEMFEADDQVILNEYLAGQIKLDHLKKEAKVWPNYDTDYGPLVEYAKEKQIAFVATNVPRRYASLVSREGIEGLDALSKEAKAFMPKLPFLVTEGDKGYEKMKAMMGGHGSGMDMDKLIAAQALKDYTMAHFIDENMKKGTVFIHFNGTFHSNDRSGICNYLLAENKKALLGTISSVEAETLEWNTDWEGLADYVIVKPTTMTKTH